MLAVTLSGRSHLRAGCILWSGTSTLESREKQSCGCLKSVRTSTWTCSRPTKAREICGKGLVCLASAYPLIQDVRVYTQWKIQSGAKVRAVSFQMRPVMASCCLRLRLPMTLAYFLLVLLPLACVNGIILLAAIASKNLLQKDFRAIRCRRTQESHLLFGRERSFLTSLAVNRVIHRNPHN